MLRWQFLDKNTSSVPSQTILETSLPVMKIDQEELKTPPSSGVRILWIGHASTLVQFEGISVLTDPVFSDRCGLYSKFGPKRFRPSPVTVRELPKIDAVIISHSHYDHLDQGTVRDLYGRFGDGLKWFVPIGNLNWFAKNGCTNVEEMTWWQESKFSTAEGNEFTFVCTPCQHWSNRGLFDRCKTLWSSWVIRGQSHSFFFGGDTGYCEAFKEIGEAYGPFTAAAIPIGAYKPRDCLKPQHVDPEEAVKIHQDVKSQSSVGIHWGTFTLTYEHYLEPPLKLKQVLEAEGLKEDAFITLRHGEAKTFHNSSTEDKAAVGE